MIILKPTEKIILNVNERERRIMRRYIWYNIMKFEKSNKDLIKQCPYCNEWLKEKEIMRHFWARHKDEYYKIYKLLFNDGRND